MFTAVESILAGPPMPPITVPSRLNEDVPVSGVASPTSQPGSRASVGGGGSIFESMLTLPLTYNMKGCEHSLSVSSLLVNIG